jgi:hypothetical protein
MPRKPNYFLERAERNRAKEARKQKKLRRRQEHGLAQAGEEPHPPRVEGEPESGDQGT